MRGAHVRCMTVENAVGIIPADAGSTVGSMVAIHCLWDHPRRCGEHNTRPSPDETHSGSSPQMRGAHPLTAILILQQRIIPADAGSTLAPGSDGGVPGDHPRRCGEHVSVCSPHRTTMGSSPQMRGAPKATGKNIAQSRIIPADAGSTVSTPTSCLSA